MSPDTCGTFIGSAKSAAASSLSIIYDNKVIKKTNVNTIVTTTPCDAAIIGTSVLNDNKTVYAGNDFYMDLELLQRPYPYGSTRHIKHPIVYALLPDGITVNTGTLNKHKGTNELLTVNAERTKSITIDGSIFNV